MGRQPLGTQRLDVQLGTWGHIQGSRWGPSPQPSALSLQGSSSLQAGTVTRSEVSEQPWFPATDRGTARLCRALRGEARLAPCPPPTFPHGAILGDVWLLIHMPHSHAVTTQAPAFVSGLSRGVLSLQGAPVPRGAAETAPWHAGAGAISDCPVQPLVGSLGCRRNTQAGGSAHIYPHSPGGWTSSQVGCLWALSAASSSGQYCGHRPPWGLSVSWSPLLRTAVRLDQGPP